MIRWWVELARTWFRLPAGNASLPGDPQRQVTWNPGRGYLHYSLLGFFASSILSLPLALALVGGGLLSLLSPAANAPREGALLVGLALGFGGAVMLLSTAVRFAIIYLELDMLRYTLTDQAIRLRRGVVNVQEVTLSYVNVQNVRFVQGPLQRYFGIADLLVETAGGGALVAAQQQQQQQVAHRGLIKGVSEPQQLRDLILERVRQAKGSGLGDAHDDAADERPAAGAGSLSSPAALALLKEIRDGLAAANREA